MAAIFSNRNTTNLTHQCDLRAVIWVFGQKGDAMRRCGINRVVFTGIFMHEAVL